MKALNKLKSWFRRTHKIVPLNTFNPTNHMSTVKAHRTVIESYPCPKCGNSNLKVLSLEEGDKGWEATVQCSRCQSSMTLNNTGFRANFQDKIGIKNKRD
jgi:hypothetical protein